MKSRTNILANIDWIIIILYLLLVFLGWINIYSVEYNEETAGSFSFASRHGRQLLWIIFAMIIAGIVVIIDSKFYMYLAWPLYIFMLFLLISVLLIGKEIHGSRSWFVLGGFQFQPSEFAKFITALVLAKYLSSPNMSLKSFKSIIQSVALIFIPAIFILLQPDTGSSLVYASLFIVLYREGLPGIYVLIGFSLMILFILTLVFNKFVVVAGITGIAFLLYFFLEPRKKLFLNGFIIFTLIAGGLAILGLILPGGLSNSVILILSLVISGIIYSALAYIHKLKHIVAIFLFVAGSIIFVFSVDYVFNNILGDHQQKRINVVLGIESDPLGSGYNVNQSKIAIGSGGMWGKGFLRGTQTKFNFVPEQSTDFIFCTVGEEWGFAGSLVLISLFLLLLFRVLFIAERQKNKFNRVYAYSVFSILFFHFVINIGMTIGLVPVIGIPLPFISYGGSSLWAFTILIFILVKIDASRTESL